MEAAIGIEEWEDYEWMRSRLERLGWVYDEGFAAWHPNVLGRISDHCLYVITEGWFGSIDRLNIPSGKVMSISGHKRRISMEAFLTRIGDEKGLELLQRYRTSKKLGI